MSFFEKYEGSLIVSLFFLVVTSLKNNLSLYVLLLLIVLLLIVIVGMYKLMRENKFHFGDIFIGIITALIYFFLINE